MAGRPGCGADIESDGNDPPVTKLDLGHERETAVAGGWPPG
jgi:hypothetical protein